MLEAHYKTNYALKLPCKRCHSLIISLVFWLFDFPASNFLFFFMLQSVTVEKVSEILFFFCAKIANCFNFAIKNKIASTLCKMFFTFLQEPIIKVIKTAGKGLTKQYPSHRD